MTKSLLLCIFILSISTIYAQEFNQWVQNHKDSEIIIYHGVYNNCIPFKIGISQIQDSIVGTWQLDDKETYFLNGKVVDNVAQLIEFNSAGDVTGYFLYRTDLSSPTYAYWINKNRNILRVFPISGTGQKNIKKHALQCKTMDNTICVKQVDPHTFKGTIFNHKTQNFSYFSVNDSFYVKTYSHKTLLPKKNIFSLNHPDVISIENCISAKQSSSIEIDAYCRNTDSSSYHLAFPAQLKKELQSLILQLDSTDTFHPDFLNNSSNRFQHLTSSEIIPFYIDSKMASFLLFIDKDNRKVPYAINWSRKDGRLISPKDIFKRRFNFDAFMDQKTGEAKKTLSKIEPENIDFIHDLNFPSMLFNQDGFIFISNVDEKLGWRSFYVPYEDLKDNFKWFHPLKNIVRNGHN